MTSEPRTWAVVLAGGVGRRLGADRPKQLLELGGRTVLEHSVAAFADRDDVHRVVVVAPEGSTDAVGALVPGALVVVGGEERVDSTRLAVAAVLAAGGAPRDKVLVHDAARPLVPGRVVDDVVAALDHHEAVATLVETADTIVQVDPATGDVASVLPRASLRRHQTPQGFRLGLLAEVHEAALRVGDEGLATDDCSLVLRHRPDVAVGSVPGDVENLKITDPSDLVLARALLAARESPVE